MKIMNRLTMRLLWENKRRTLVTLLGVIISVAMLTAVAAISVSFMDLLKRQTIADEGEWHVTYEGVDADQLEAIKSDENTKKTVLSNDLGYVEFDADDKYTPYLFVKEYSDSGLTQFPITVTDGRLPEAEDEIIVSEPVLDNGDDSYEIGDTITLDIGERMSDDPDIAGSMNQTYSFQVDAAGDVQEHISDTTEQSFEIVGSIQKPAWEPVDAPGYTVIAYLDEDGLGADDTVNASVVLKKLNKNTITEIEQFASEHHIDSFELNKNLLRYEGVISNDGMRIMLYSLSAIIMAIIIVGAVALIYNAFAISVAERSKQLGMLASVGATKQQKRNSVFFEGMLIAAAGIPIGIIAGLGGMAVTFMYMNSFLDDALGLTEELQLVVTPVQIVVAVFVSLLTIFISTFIPAKRASRVSAIDAIRQTQDVKLEEKKIKTNKLVRKLFGFEATIGLKNLKRNKRSYQAAIISIVISIILFLSVSYFTSDLRATTDMTKNLHNDDMAIMLGYDDDDVFIKAVQDMDEVTDTNVMQKVNDDVMAMIEEENMDEYFRENCVPDKNDNCPYVVNLYALDDDEFKAFVDESDITADVVSGAVVIDSYTYVDEETGKRGETSSLNADLGDHIRLAAYNWEEHETTDIDDITLIGLTDDMPLGVETPNMGQLSMIVSENTFQEFAGGALMEFQHDKYLHVKSDDPIKTQENIENIENEKHSIQNYYQYMQDDKQMILLLSVFTYGFIALITTISIANILNTLSTSISLRTREFAMLKSVGMTPRGFRKMIRYESIFYGLKSLLYGLPISIGIMYLMYKAFSEGYDYSFTLPWISILIAIFAVFLIVGTTMVYASSKVKKKNIIDALKQENI